jgi:hypothetical protein
VICSLQDSTIYRYNLTSTPHRPGVDQDLRRRYLDDDTKELYRQRDKVKKFHVENNRRAVTDEATQESTQPLHRRVVDKEGGFRNLLKSNDSP